MAKWRIVAGPRTYEPVGSDCPVGWAWNLESDAGERSVKVEMSATAYVTATNHGRLPSDEAEKARLSRGRAAVLAYLDHDDPPVRIVVSTHKVEPEVD